MYIYIHTFIYIYIYFYIYAMCCFLACVTSWPLCGWSRDHVGCGAMRCDSKPDSLLNWPPHISLPHFCT